MPGHHPDRGRGATGGNARKHARPKLTKASKTITIAPLDQQLTTQEAANFLGTSRPTLVKLLDQGEISFERLASGRHRRVRLDDVLDYQRRKRASRRATLDELTEQAVEAGLYDEVTDFGAPESTSSS